MHQPTHDVFLQTRHPPADFDAELQHALAVLDPGGHIQAKVRAPRPAEWPALERLAGRRPSLLALVSMTPDADASALVCALVHALRGDPEAWVRLSSIDGTLVDLHPGLLGLPPLPERPAILRTA